jgi:type IV pilus assembly protein PilM
MDSRRKGISNTDMAKKLNSVLGIDIGSQRIKIAEMRVQGKDPVITALGMIDTPEGAVDHTGVFNSDAVGQALKQVLSSSGTTVSLAVVSIAGQASVLVRTLEVPKMNPTELRDHMQWEINRNIPFAESTIVSDYKPLGDDDPNSANMDVVMAIAPQSAIDTMVACVKKAGRSVTAIDVEPMSIARTIHTSYDDQLGEKTSCIVDIGHTTSSINIYHGQKLLMPRQVPIGGEMFTRTIADAYTTPLPEAEQMKIERLVIPDTAGASTTVADPFGIAPTTDTGTFQAYNPFGDAADHVVAAEAPPADVAPFQSIPTEDEPVVDATTQIPPIDHVDAPPPTTVITPAVETPDSKLFHTVSPVLEELVAEIRRSIDYYKSRGGDVQQIEICGGGSKIRGLVGYLERSLGIPCDAYDPTRRLNINPRKVPQGFVDEHRQEFAVAIGNGLHIFFD